MDSVTEKIVDGCVDLALADRKELRAMCSDLIATWDRVGVYGFMAKDGTAVPELLALLAKLRDKVR